MTRGRPSQAPVTIALVFVGGLGPALTAAVLVAIGRSEESLRTFWRRLLDPRGIPGIWYAAIPVVAFLPALAGRRTAGSGGLSMRPPTGTVLAVALVTALSEEPGWRGYAQDDLQRRLPVAVVALIVGAVWGAWHLPLFFIEGTVQQGLGLGSAASWSFFGSVVLLAVVYAWLYAGTAGSTLAVVLAHAGQNTAAALLSVPEGRLAELAVLASLALLVCLADRRRMWSTAASRARPQRPGRHPGDDPRAGGP